MQTMPPGATLSIVDGDAEDSGGLDAAQRARRLRARLQLLGVEMAEVGRLERVKRLAYAETSRVMSERAARHWQDAEAYAAKGRELRDLEGRILRALEELEDGA